MKFFDTHCHLGDKKLKHRVEEILLNAEKAEVAGLCVICADQQNVSEFDEFIPQIHQISRANNLKINIYRSAGLHPHEAQHWNKDIENKIESQLTKDAIAVGETGLDYHYNFSDEVTQKLVFKRHIDWSCEFQLPLVIHCREAAEDILKSLNRDDIKKHPHPGILHCFTDTKEVARKLLDQNFMISFSGIVTFKNAESLREVANYIPEDRLLIETDSPYLAPMPYRGKINEPAFVKHTFDLIAESRKANPQKLSEALWNNSIEVYQLKI